MEQILKVLRGVGKILLVLLLMVLAVAAILALALGLTWLVETVMAPEGWLFFQFSVYLEWAIVIVLGIPVIYGGRWIAKHLLHMNTKYMDEDMISPAFIKRHFLLFAVAWLLGLYICCTSVTFVTEDTIVRHSPLCPWGHSYGYDEVTGVETDFGHKFFSFFDFKEQGSFSYRVLVGGKKIIFSVPDINDEIDRYVDDSYLELEELDQRLMALGVPKVSKEEYWDECYMDQVYVDRFLRIVRNQPKG